MWPRFFHAKTCAEDTTPPWPGGLIDASIRNVVRPTAVGSSDSLRTFYWLGETTGLEGMNLSGHKYLSLQRSHVHSNGDSGKGVFYGVVCVSIDRAIDTARARIGVGTVGAMRRLIFRAAHDRLGC